MVVFDLDGVIFDSKDLHYESLNRALEDLAPDFVISYTDHVARFDGLPTSKKLDILTRDAGLDPKLHAEIKRRKQEYTESALEDSIAPAPNLIALFSSLKEDGIKVYVATNAVRLTAEMILWKTGVRKYVDHIISNEDVSHPKPHPEIYLRAMLHAKAGPRETLIVEDSYVGRQAVFASGAKLCAVRSTNDVTITKVYNDMQNGLKPRWKDDSLNVLVPMAGAGSRFAKAGYTFPKPLIEVNGKPMIQVVCENLSIDAHYIFVVQKSHYEQYSLKYVLNTIAPNCDIIQIDGVTEGAACTTLLAEKIIDSPKQLLIANSDQFMEWDSSEFMYSMQPDYIDGGILTFDSTHPKWSYAKVSDAGFVTEVQEKKPISRSATVGVYYWKRGSDYIHYAKQMIAKNLRVNNEFYVCPVYNEAIQDGKKVKIYDIQKMWGLGTPEDLNLFLQNHEKLSS